MVQSACQYVLAFRFYKTSKIKGYVKMTIYCKFGHFGLNFGSLCLKNRAYKPCVYETRAQELTSGAIRMFSSLFVWIWEWFKDQMVWGSFRNIDSKGNFDSFHKFWYILASNRPNIEKLVTKMKIFWCFSWFWKKF